MHEMKLNNGPFESIKNGTKTIELRLNDEKRQLLKVNDIIYIIMIHLLNYIYILIKYQWDIKKMKKQIQKIWKNIIQKKNKINMECLE